MRIPTDLVRMPSRPHKTGCGGVRGEARRLPARRLRLWSSSGNLAALAVRRFVEKPSRHLWTQLVSDAETLAVSRYKIELLTPPRNCHSHNAARVGGGERLSYER